MLTHEQIRTFHRDGFLSLTGIFSSIEIELLRRGAAEVETDGIARKDPYHYYHSRSNGDFTYYRSERMWGRMPIFAAATVNPTLLDCVGQCIGHPFFPINSSLVSKIPNGDVPIRWHQDAPYKNPAMLETFEVPHFTVDIYLDDTSVENSCVWGIPGHHLVGHVGLDKFSEQELYEYGRAVPFEMCAGDVLFHCLSAPHGSMGNRSDRPRRTFYIQYVTDDDFFETHYGSFARQYGESFTPAELLQERSALNLVDSPRSTIRITADSRAFEFVGDPKTPPRHWRKLIDEISSEERAQKRGLFPDNDT